jgi:molybdopterin synthase catalytic subunit
MIDVRVQSGDFDPGRQLDRLRELGKAAVVGSLAVVEAGAEVAGIVVEHYPAMARAELARIAEEAERRWDLAGIVLIHRHGRFAPGDRLLFVGVAAARRPEALEALGYMADQVRARGPFWRQELLAGGGARWTDPAELP